MENNKIVLKNTYGKAGIRIKIYPCPMPNGMMPPCVRKVDSHGDMILSEADKKAWSTGTPFIPDNEPIVVEHNTVFDLDDPLQAAQWEAIKNSKLIAPERTAKDSSGNFLIDGGVPYIDQYNNPHGRYGLAELYIERPGRSSDIRMTLEKRIYEAKGLVFNDSKEHQVMICRLYDKDMSHAHNADIEAFLIDQAQSNPDRLIKYYNSEESAARLLVLMARDAKVISVKSDGMYYSDIKLGRDLDSTVEMLKLAENKPLRAAIQNETFPELKAKQGKTSK